MHETGQGLVVVCIHCNAQNHAVRSTFPNHKGRIKSYGYVEGKSPLCLACDHPVGVSDHKLPSGMLESTILMELVDS